jgi:ABC-2 type transport system ATP-binding protein
MIVVSNLSKTYGRLGRRRVKALDALSFTVRRGETLGLIGPNGAGKTTLLSCLLGFLRPDAGSIAIGGLPPDDLSVRARTGYMPERLGFDRDLTGTAFLEQHWRLAGGGAREGRREAAASAARVGLEPAALGRRLSGYSRGMLQRIGLAQAMLRDPELLFLDEPASGTDPLGVAVVRDRILEAKARGATIVLNSHQLPEVERVCDRVVFLSAGRAAEERTLRGEASALRGQIRVPPGRSEEAAAVLAAAGFSTSPAGPGALRFDASGDDDVARAVRAVVLADLPVLEARASADLEEMFRRGGAA